MTEAPPEPPDGQDPDPPDLDLLLHAVRVLLRDVANRLDPDDTGDDDLALRARAVRGAVVRYIVTRGQ